MVSVVGARNVVELSCKVRYQHGDSGALLFVTDGQNFTAIGICSRFLPPPESSGVQYGLQADFVPLTELETSVYDLP